MKPRPPALTRRVLDRVLPSNICGESILGDLEEEFRARAERDGASRASRWYRRQAWQIIAMRAFAGGRGGEAEGVVPEALAQDLRQAVRILVRSPGTSALVIVALALGIGANTAIFSAVDAVLLRPLDFEHPERVVQIMDRFQSAGGRAEVPLSFPNFRDYEQAASFRRVAAIRGTTVYAHEGEERPERVAAHVSSDLFAMMEVRPLLGRGFTEEEDRLDPTPVVLLSHHLWERDFAGDSAVVGRTLTISHWTESDRTYVPVMLEIAGVLPPDFNLPAIQMGDAYRKWVEPDMLLPLGMWDWGRGRRGMRALRAVAELAPGVTLAQAREEMSTLGAGIAATDPDASGLSVHLVPLDELRRSRYATVLGVLWASSLLILLIVCLNVASLLFGRALARERELAVRTALGASRGRLVRQLLAESAVLGLAGAAAGLLLAHQGTAVLRRLTPGNVQGLSEAGLDLRVLAFSAGATLLTILLFGLAPAVWGTRARPAESMRSGARSGVAGNLRPLRGMVVTQVAFSMALLVGSGLLLRSLDHLLAIDPGFEPEQTLHFTLEVPPEPIGKRMSPPEVLAYYDQLRGRLQSIPYVLSVGAGRVGLLSGVGPDWDVTMADRPAPPPEERRMAYHGAILPGFLETIGTPVVRGRPLGDDDVAALLARPGPTTPIPVLVNRRMAEHHWPDQDPLGKRFYWGIQDPEVVAATLGLVESSDQWDPRYPQPRPLEVVGVVADIRSTGLVDDPPMAFYRLVPAAVFDVYVRVAGDPAEVIPALRDEIRAVNPDFEISASEPLALAVREATADTRFQASLLASFAGLAVLMTGLGLFGVLAYAVRRRTHEMAVRMSLGARREEVSWMILSDGLRLGVPGLVLGLGMTLLGVRFLSSMLYGVSGTDPLTLAASASLIMLVTVAACWIPALQATRVDPMRVLREE